MSRFGRSQPQSVFSASRARLVAGAASLSGLAASASSTNGTLTTGAPLSGLAASTSTTTGVLAIPQFLSGLAASNSTTTGVLTTVSPLTGLATSASTASGTITTAAPLSGLAASASSTSGVVSVVAGAFLTGLAASASSTSGTLFVPAPAVVPSPSPRFKATAYATDKTQITTIEIWTGPSASAAPVKIADLTKFLTVATWTEDETQSPRWTCSVTLESKGPTYDNLVPYANGDLLQPLTGNELRIFHGYRWSDGTQELIPQGVYRMSKPQITDDGTKIEIVITGNDRAIEVTKRSWVGPYIISGAPTYDSAIHDLINNRLPGLTYNLKPSAHQVPNIVFGTLAMTSAVDPMGDAIQLATADATELFFDDVGVLTSRTIPDPTTTPVVFNFIEGPNCVMNSVQRVLDETQTFNGVVATSSTAGVQFPVQEIVWVTDPTSPLNPATFGYVPYFYTSPLFTTAAQAIAAATALLQTLLTAYDDISFTAPNYAPLRCGNAVAVTRSRVRIADTYCVSHISRSSDPTQQMSVTCRARRTAS